MHTRKLLVLVFALIVAGVSFVLYQSGYFSSTDNEYTESPVVSEQNQPPMFNAQERAEFLKNNPIEAEETTPEVVDSREMTAEEFAKTMSLSREEVETLLGTLSQ